MVCDRQLRTTLDDERSHERDVRVDDRERCPDPLCFLALAAAVEQSREVPASLGANQRVLATCDGLLQERQQVRAPVERKLVERARLEDREHALRASSAGQLRPARSKLHTGRVFARGMREPGNEKGRETQGREGADHGGRKA